MAIFAFDGHLFDVGNELKEQMKKRIRFLKVDDKTHEKVFRCFHDELELNELLRNLHSAASAIIGNGAVLYSEFNHVDDIYSKIDQVLILIEFVKSNMDLLQDLVRKCEIEVFTSEDIEKDLNWRED